MRDRGPLPEKGSLFVGKQQQQQQQRQQQQQQQQQHEVTDECSYRALTASAGPTPPGGPPIGGVGVRGVDDLPWTDGRRESAGGREPPEQLDALVPTCLSFAPSWALGC
ncbi:hypothetical protein ACSSS7_003458 [Eimeria intestinalis]